MRRLQFIHRYVVLGLGLVALAGLLAACNQEPTPIIVYVTPTPEATEDTNPSGEIPPSPTNEPIAATVDITAVSMANTEVAAIPVGITPTATTPPVVTATPSATETLEPTPTPTRRRRTPTVTPTPRATHTPSPTHTPRPIPNVPPADQLPIFDTARFGIQVHPFVTREEWTYVLGNVDQVGSFDWVKIQLDWSQLEPVRGQYNDLFYTYVQRVQWANFEGARPYKVLLSVAKAPDWSRPPGFDPSHDGPPADPNELVRFITDFIRETKPQDNRIGAIEVWNEPNLEREWNGVQMDGQTYMQYFVPVYNGIRAIAPNITIITAGLAPVGDVGGAVSDRRYLQQMYDGGLANYADVRVGIHPYGWGNPPDAVCCTEERGWANNPVFYFRNTLDDYIAIMNRNGHAAKVWVTEFGWGTYDGILNGDDMPAPPAAQQFDLVTEKQQAEYTVKAMDMLQTPPYADVVEVAILWNLNFATIGEAVANGQEQAGYSLIGAGGNRRLVYLYLQQARKQYQLTPN